MYPLYCWKNNSNLTLFIVRFQNGEGYVTVQSLDVGCTCYTVKLSIAKDLRCKAKSSVLP